jgi:hypothetical protein
MVAEGYDISRAGNVAGLEPSPRRAAQQTKGAWFEAIRGTSREHEVPQAPPVNAYAAAKARG